MALTDRGVTPAGTVRGLIESLVVFSAALVIRIWNFPEFVVTDELYHLLAASSLNTTGDLAIADGYYTRAGWFTYLISVVMAVTGDSLESVRFFCAILGAFLVTAVFFGVSRIAGRSEAWIAALILTLMPGAIFLSQYIRFYSLHAMLFWLAAIAAFIAVYNVKSLYQRGLLALLVLVLLAASLHLQISTAIGAVGIAIWLFVVNLRATTTWFFALGIRERSILLGLIIVAAVLGFVLFFDVFVYLLTVYRAAPLWSAGQNPLYYVYLYNDIFGVFWALLPIAMVVATLTSPRVAVFSICIFSTAFVFQSFGGLQAERFNFYAMPFFATIWSLALVKVGRMFVDWVESSINQAGLARSAAFGSRAIALTLLAGSMLFVAVSTPATELTARMLTDKTVSIRKGRPYYWSRYTSDWGAATERLSNLTDGKSVFLTSQGLHAIYYLGDYDIELSATRLSDFDWMADDNVDPRTGRPVIGDVEGLRQVVACYPTGLLVIHSGGWRRKSVVDDRTANWIEQNLSREQMPEASGLLAFSWSQDVVDSSCNLVGRVIGLLPR